MTRRILNYSLLILVIAALVIAGTVYYIHGKNYPSTDDAYIQANVIDVAPQVNGRILSVSVKDQEYVKKNQLLFTIDPTPFNFALQKATADLTTAQQQAAAAENAVQAAAALLAQREAELINAKKNYDRVTTLVKEAFYAQSSGDEAVRELAVAKQAVIAARDNLAEAKATRGKLGDQNAQILAAKAALAEAALNLQYTKITAPSSGQIAQLTLRPGQTVTAYQSLFSLVSDKKWWATANMKETDLSRVRVGQSALVHVDMYPQHVFKGVVTSVSPGSGASFALLPPENATGNWVKVTQRFPVRIDIAHPDAAFPLRIGASCTVSINTLSKTS